eukprot:5950080-Pleurochrysis_carterae.AAC.1
MAMPASVEGHDHHPQSEGVSRPAERGRSARRRPAGTAVRLAPGCWGLHGLHLPSRPGGPQRANLR